MLLSAVCQPQAALKLAITSNCSPSSNKIFQYRLLWYSILTINVTSLALLLSLLGWRVEGFFGWVAELIHNFFHEVKIRNKSVCIRGTGHINIIAFAWCIVLRKYHAFNPGNYPKLSPWHFNCWHLCWIPLSEPPHYIRLAVAKHTDWFKPASRERRRSWGENGYIFDSTSFSQHPKDSLSIFLPSSEKKVKYRCFN